MLLPRVRDDIAEYKRLNFHLYQALRKALFKPGAFFKGFLLPLCEVCTVETLFIHNNVVVSRKSCCLQSGTCSLREAVIIAGVIAKNSIPMLHSAAAILKIAEMEYTGANSIFLKTLLDKKYALPYRVIDATVYHFLRYVIERVDSKIIYSAV